MGYHRNKISKGKFGEFSKVKEEFQEFEDAVEQNDIILQMCELSDIVGAIEGYAIQHLGITIENIIKFKDKTKKAFIEGNRK